MKQIPLTRGYVAIVDDEDYEVLMQYRWFATASKRRVYAAKAPSGSSATTKVYMHRMIAGSDQGQHTDHINGDTLDNRRSNLRVCTNGENNLNKPVRRDNKSGYKGVSWAKANGKWQAQIQLHGRRVHIGHFTDPVDAARAYDRKAIELHGAFARLNFPHEI